MYYISCHKKHIIPDRRAVKPVNVNASYRIALTWFEVQLNDYGKLPIIVPLFQKPHNSRLPDTFVEAVIRLMMVLDDEQKATLATMKAYQSN